MKTVCVSEKIYISCILSHVKKPRRGRLYQKKVFRKDFLVILNIVIIEEATQFKI
jgi:hypothetical protein